MKLVRYLEKVELVKSVNKKQSNGTFIKTFTKIGDYRVQKKSLDDEVSATIYGANITKMLEISTALGDLEEYLIPKVDNQKDNVSFYFIVLNDTRYKISSVRSNGITIERVAKNITTPVSL